MPILVFLAFYRSCKTQRALWVITIACIVSFLNIKAVDLTEGRTKLHAINLYTLFEYSFFAAFLWFSINNKKIRRVLVLASVLFITFLIYYNLFATFERFDSVPIGIETILILTFSFYCFYEITNDPSLKFMFDDHRFWFVLGMIIYLAGSFFIYILSEQLTQEQYKKYEWIPHMLYIIKSALFALGMYFFHRQIRSNNNNNTIKPIPFLDLNL